MTCLEAREALSPYLDDKLAETAQDALRAHLGGCPGCRGELDGLRALSRLLRDLPRRPLPTGFMERLHKRRSGASSGEPERGINFRPFALALAGLAAGLVLYRARAPMDIPEPVVPAAVPAAPAKAAGGRGGAPMGATPSLSNAQLQGVLRAESEELGMEPADAGAVRAAADPFMGERLGEPGTREQAEFHIRRLAALRRNIEENDGKPRGVAVGGKTARLLAEKSEDGGRALEPEPGPTERGSARPSAPSEKALAPTDDWSGPYSNGHEEGTFMIQDGELWESLWRTLSKKPLPPVDFVRQQVAAVFLGPRPSGGHEVEILSAKISEDKLVVEWRERRPAPGKTPPDGKTTPYALKAVPATGLPVRFSRLSPIDR